MKISGKNQVLPKLSDSQILIFLVPNKRINSLECWACAFWFWKIWNLAIFTLFWANFKGKFFDFRWKFAEKLSASETPGYSNTYCFSANWKYKQFGVLSMRSFSSGKSET